MSLQGGESNYSLQDSTKNLNIILKSFPQPSRFMYFHSASEFKNIFELLLFLVSSLLTYERFSFGLKW